MVVCAYGGWPPRLPHRACLSGAEAPGSRSRVANAISGADAVGALEAGRAREHNAGHQSAGHTAGGRAHPTLRTGWFVCSATRRDGTTASHPGRCRPICARAAGEPVGTTLVVPTLLGYRKSTISGLKRVVPACRRRARLGRQRSQARPVAWRRRTGAAALVRQRH